MEKVKLTIGKVINFFKNLLERVLLIYKNKEILIVLESKSPIAFKFETGIIANILMVFSDEMLNRSAIDFKKES